jgi:hypothetical protein
MTDAIRPTSDPKTVAPTIRTFKGASSLDQQSLRGLSFTPDSNGAASYSYFVEFINTVFSIYDKQTGTLVASRVTDTQFWQAAGISRPSNIVDPRVVFIPNAGRNGQWLAVQLDLGYRVLIATTDPHDPLADPRLGKWKASAFDLPGNDFTMLGYDLNGVYIGTNTSNTPPTPPPPPKDKRSPQIVFIPRAKALAYPPEVGPDDIKITSPLHYEEFGDSLYPAIDQSGVGWPYETLIGIDNLSRKHLTFSLFSPQFREILSFGTIEVDPFQPVPTGYRVKQPSSDAFNAVIWANDGLVSAPMADSFNIWVAQTVYREHYGSLAVRWYRLALDTQSRMPSVAASGEIFQPFYDCFNPSILSFGKDDYTVVSLSRGGNGNRVPIDPGDPMCGNLGAYVALVREADPTPQIFPLQSGLVPNYFPPRGQRWGDYSTICRDPNPGTRRAWIVNQYALQGGQSESQWSDIIAAIDLP